MMGELIFPLLIWISTDQSMTMYHQCIAIWPDSWIRWLSTSQKHHLDTLSPERHLSRQYHIRRPISEVTTNSISPRAARFSEHLDHLSTSLTMKVIEEGTDRSAEMHFHVHGSVVPLTEYGEYVASDYAVCCYVPVEEGEQPKISGIFTGTVSPYKGLLFAHSRRGPTIYYDF